MKKDPELPDYQLMLATIYSRLGDLLCSDKGRTAEAEAAYKEAIDIHKILIKKHPEVPEYQNLLAVDYFYLGVRCGERGKATEAETAYKESLAIWKILMERYPEVLRYQQNLAACHERLGCFYLDKGRAKEAAAALQSALSVCRSLTEGHPSVSEYRKGLANAYYNLACYLARSLAAKNGSADSDAAQSAASVNASSVKAFDYLQQACDLGVFDDTGYLEHMKRDSDLDGLRGRPEYKKLLEKIAARPKPDSKPTDTSTPNAAPIDPTNTEAFVNRGSKYFDQGQRDKAEADFEEALRADPLSARAFFERGEALAKANHPERALAEYREAVWLDPEPRYTEGYLRHMLTPADKALDQMIADFRPVPRLRAEIDPTWLHWMSCWLPFVSRGAGKLPGMIWVSDMPWVRSTCGFRCPEATKMAIWGVSGLASLAFRTSKGS